MNSRIAFYALLMLVTVSFFGCKKDDDNSGTNNSTTGTTQNPGNNTPTGRLMFHLHTYLDNNEVDDYGIVYTMDDGRKISLDLAQLYLSDIRLVKLDGSEIMLTGKNVLKLREIETYVVGDVPVGNYKSLRFKIGLDAATNQLTPLASPDSAILNRPEMWFGSNAQPDGYVFMNLQGKIDTTADASGTKEQMQSFTYKIGTNSHYIQVNMPDKNYTVLKDQVEFAHILIDYYRLFNGINLGNQANLSVSTAAANANPPATSIVGNIPLMFEYEE
jgi:hypothetical protein